MVQKRKARTIKLPQIIRGIVLVYFVILILQLMRWQIFDHERFSALANDQRTAQSEIFTKRGTVYTQDGVVLSVDSPSWNVVLSVVNDVDKKRFLEKRTEIIDLLGELLPIDKNEIFKKTEVETLSYVVLVTNVNKRQKDIIDSKQYPGIYTKEAPRRMYPNGKLASHIIGYVGPDQNGNPQGYYGLEGFFWGDIKGKRGLSSQERDLMGNAIISTEYKNVSFREGKNLVLTINSGIQKKVEKFLEEGVREYEADGGAVIVMNPKTGEIVAMAGFPTYDPNFFWQTEEVTTFKNKAVSDPYEFGSVQKALTIAMAMNEGKLTENDICDDTGKLELLDKVIYNYGKAKYGKITPKDTLRHSDNICAAQYGLSVGPSKMYDYLIKFGYGTAVGIGLQEEEGSVIKDPKEWVETDTATISFGQTVSATPLQVISAFSVIANEGERMQPLLVKKIYNNEEEISVSAKSHGQVVRPEVARKVAGMLEYAIMSQKEMNRFKGRYAIAGKTGTAQIAKKDGPGYYEDRVNVTFIGFSPTYNTRVIMLVKLENPRKSGLANLTVLPLWGKIFDGIKDDLGVPQVNQ
jgi:stage V sporulation protein D (sporulation-specific penicillin-binding protein)